MALASLKPSSKGVTVLIIMAVGIFFGVALVYLAIGGKMKSLDSELASKQKEVQDSKKIALTLQQSKLDYLDARAQIRCLESSVSTQAYVPTMLKQLEYLGKSVNLKVLSVRPQPVAETQSTRTLSSGAQAANGNVEGASQEKQDASNPNAAAAQKKETKPYDELPVEIEVAGSYMNALDFLYRLTSFPKIISVNSLQVSPTGQTEPLRSPDLDIKLSVTAFVFKTGQSADSQAQAQIIGNRTERVISEAGTATRPSVVSKGRAGNEAG